jgi:hypothetical protein
MLGNKSTLDISDPDAFWQRLILPEEERRHLYPDYKWSGGYRWFRSPNVYPIEKYRHRKQEAQIQSDET